MRVPDPSEWGVAALKHPYRLTTDAVQMIIDDQWLMDANFRRADTCLISM
ncbi:MAG: hypothetical protein VX949_06200 [Planctomycetota bacterium]|nr:hypothetical protein [Planctomycetota bacterium]